MKLEECSKSLSLVQFARSQFPHSSKYDLDWMIENHIGLNAVWLTEALCQVMDIRPEMRVLDLGCGKAIGSIFLAKEFGCQVWATDLWFDRSDNLKRICDADAEDLVFPLQEDARKLPFDEGFFD